VELLADLVDGRAAVVFTHDAVARAAVAWTLGAGVEVYRHVEVANCLITTVGVVAGVRGLLRTNEKSPTLTASASIPDRTGSSNLHPSGFDTIMPKGLATYTLRVTVVDSGLSISTKGGGR
jgi:hypothetical protein